MIYIVYGNEPYMVKLQKERFKGRANSEFGYVEAENLLEAKNFLSGISLFADSLYAYVEVDSITSLTCKDFLSYVEEIRDKKDKNLFIYLRKVKSDAKGLQKLKEQGCYMQEYSKLSKYSELYSYLKKMSEEMGVSFKEDALMLFITQMDYFENEAVNMFVLKNQMDQLKYLGGIIDVEDVKEYVPDMREGKRFALAALIAKKESVKLWQEVARLKRNRDFSGMALMGLLHREYRIGYLLKGAGCSLSEQKVRICNVSTLEKEELAGGLQIITECMRDVKSGVYTDVEGFELCITRLCVGETM